ncbi:TetR/AcrR family transcriptional regulator [Pedobacter caeni]|uniref:Transcriptional regulator, TetR family n=1 Tax=Pedobacter caeni TaxID=288992 RepID=A0A1M5A7I3_9SPHI|nr:TetR/AcrR family transcriptional regulator [Pedobacter caeni]SHF26263.1 transcriptional regulator, TetR family [Pedobacter caeni]
MNKKEQILTATLKLIVQKGIESTPMSEIAKAADTGMGAIYNHFPNKESLVSELYFYLKAKESAIIMQGYDPSLSVKQRFVYLWKRMIGYFMAEPMDFMFLEQFYYSPAIDPKAKHEGSLYVSVLDSVYLDGQAQQIIKEGNVKEWIGFTSGSLVSLVKLHHSDYISLQEDSIERYIQAAWDAIRS